MSRILGIDYGTRRIGLAISDESRVLAFPYRVLDQKGDESITVIGEVCRKENIDRIVIGIPHGLQGSDTAMTREAMRFADALKVVGIPTERVNEFFSSKEAARGASSKDKIDASAAAIVLQSYLERMRDMID